MPESKDQSFLFGREAFAIRGAIFQVYRTMGCGFLEAVYQECLALELAKRAIPFEAQQALRLSYGATQLKQSYVSDFVCFGAILLEIKAVRTLAPEHRAQLLNYLRATDLQLGLLVNFGASPGVEIERLALTRSPSASSAFSAVS
jgi:GxxExxY protein